MLVDGVCVAEESVVCGDNTEVVDGECRPTALVCGASLVFLDGRCQIPVPSVDVLGFIERTDLVEGAYSTTFGFGSGVEHTFRYVATDLSEASAAAWANAEASMVGDGLAFHVGGRIYAGDSNDVQAGSISDDTAPDGSCLPDLAPTAGPALADREIHIGLFSWTGGTARPVACGKAGSVTFTPSPRSITISAQLNDGSVIEGAIPVPCDSCD